MELTPAATAKRRRTPHPPIPHLNGSFPEFILGWTIGANQICVLRPPSPFILSPGRGNGCWTFLVWRMAVRQIQSREFSERRRTILLLLGEKAGMREVVNHLKSKFRRETGWTCRADFHGGLFCDLFCCAGVARGVKHKSFSVKDRLHEAD